MAGRTELQRVKRRWGVYFAIPAVLFFAAFNIYPILNALYLALTEWDLGTAPRFVGFRNFRYLVGDQRFLRSLSVTVYFTLGSAPLLVLVSLLFAVLLNTKLPFRNVYRAIYFFPVIAPVVAVSLIWSYLYHSTYGPINAVILALGGQPISWLRNVTYAMPSLIIMNVWRLSGMFMLIFLAGLQDISVDLYDSAKVDGANGLQTFFRITLPLLKPTLQLVLIITVIRSFQVFGPALLLTEGGPAGATEVLPLFLYRTGFQYFRMGYASAVAVVMLLVLIIFTIMQMVLTNRFGKSRTKTRASFSRRREAGQ